MQIKVNCYSDQKQEGVVRIWEVYYIEENDMDNGDDIVKKIWSELSEKQYFTSENNWRKEVVNDIIGCVEYNSGDIEVIVN